MSGKMLDLRFFNFFKKGPPKYFRIGLEWSMATPFRPPYHWLLHYSRKILIRLGRGVTAYCYTWWLLCFNPKNARGSQISRREVFWRALRVQCAQGRVRNLTNWPLLIVYTWWLLCFNPKKCKGKPEITKRANLARFMRDCACSARSARRIGL